MLIYEKKVNDERHLFGTMGNIPAENDAQLVYKKASGETVTPKFSDKFVDGGSANKVQRMKDLAPNINANVSVFIGNNCVIGDVPTVAAKSAPKPVAEKPIEVKKVEVKEEKAEEVKEEKAEEAKA